MNVATFIPLFSPWADREKFVGGEAREREREGGKSECVYVKMLISNQPEIRERERKE